MSAKVSVIMPVYNVENYIEESLRSVCNQSYEEIEIILVNDGTRDQSIEVAKKVLATYTGEYRIINKENGGLPSARNAGLKVATGEYVCFIDSDDIIAFNHVSDLVHTCQKYNVNASYAKFQLTYEPNRVGIPACDINYRKVEHKELLQGFLIRNLRIHCCALLMNRQYLIENDFWFNEKLRYGEDIEFMWRLFPSLDAIGSTENETYMYLQRKNSLMTAQNIDRVKVLLEVFKNNVDSLKAEYPYDNDIFKYLYGKAALAFYRTFAESSSYSTFKQLLKITNYRVAIRSVLGIDSLKLNILALCLLISPRIFVKVVKMNQETAKS